MVELKFSVEIFSKHTGERCVLGVKHNSREEAQKYAEEQVCPRCNRIEIVPVREEDRWYNRKDGFLSEERIKRKEEQKKENINSRFLR